MRRVGALEWLNPMALFGRSLKPEDADTPGARGDSDAASGTRHTIGNLLRDTRKSYGGDINHIAAMLRIRPSYLVAIEESQYDKLPGPVYAQGFVRAYAVHLGLDGEEAIRRFKHEVANLEISPDLSFPVPLAARSIPGGTMVLAALILALCGYGLWYYVSTSDRSHPERVSAVPPDLIAATKKPGPDTAATAPSSGTPTDAQIAAPGAAAANAPTFPASTLPPPVTATTASPTVSLPPGVSIAPPVPTPASTAPQAALALSTPAPPALSAQPVAAPATVAPPPADATAATPDGEPRVYGAAPNVPTRIVVRAIKDSWVQVRNGDEVLVQRTLRPGDSVRVPDIRGLSLRTGNGAGIQFEIDGKVFKPLSGTVRTVVLDPDRLAANNGSPPRTAEVSSGGLPRPGQ
jgi:cytoskeleton protein RodZ